MGLLTGYALVPCASSTKANDKQGPSKGIRLTINNSLSTGKKQTHILSPGAGSSTLATAQSLWGSKALESVVEFELSFSVEGPKMRLTASSASTTSTRPKYVVLFLFDLPCFLKFLLHYPKEQKLTVSVC
jgi:DNA mismatch repair protein PMS2